MGILGATLGAAAAPWPTIALAAPAPTASGSSAPPIARPPVPLPPAARPIPKSLIGSIAGFLSRTSGAPGDRLSLFVDTPAPAFDLRVYRLGWYDGGSRSRRLYDVFKGFPGGQQPHSTEDPLTGLISAASWHYSGVVTIGDWPTGLYDLRLRDADGRESSIPLVVRDDVRAHDLLFQHACATDQAYNRWGGRSLYNFNSVGQPTIGGGPGAVKVSFDRPFVHNDGLGQAVEWEMQMIRWLDANGWDVAYVSDLDVHTNPDFARNTKAVIQAGHSEYWSREMRDHLELARADGKGLGFFTGDTGSIAVRFEPSIIGPSRVQVCYRDASKDPLAGAEPTRVTVGWYQAPLNRPVQDLIGVGTNGEIARSAAWVVAGAADLPDIFGGTGLQDGDRVANLVGYEYDGLGTPGAPTDRPDGLHVLGRSQVAPLRNIQGPLEVAAACGFATDRCPDAGTLRADLRVAEPGPSWRLEVDVSSSLGGTRRLVYDATATAVALTTVDGVPAASIPLADRFATPGPAMLERSLPSDYLLAFGALPPDLQVDRVILRGTLAVSSFQLAAPDGSLASLVPSDRALAVSSGWSLVSGWGDLAWETDGTGAPVLSLRPSIDHRDDVAHSVLIQDGNLGPVVAVGTVQWSWALDDYGPRGDRLGNTTPVDRRVQALTANLLNYLSGRPTGATIQPDPSG